MKVYLYNFLLLSVFLIFSCEERKLEPINLSEGFDYYPLKKGNYNIYRVNEIRYSLINGNDTSEYFLKEVISDSIHDGSANYNYVINRYRKNAAEDGWEIDSVWTVRLDGTQIVKVENNVPFVKMVFPLREGKVWNGNAYNIRGEEMYLMDSLHKRKALNAMSFDSTLIVTQKRDSSSISQDYRTEIYAKGIGLIYKKSIITSNLQINGALDFPIKIDRGIDRSQIIIEYGKE